jgi:Tol biopolymer transport system component
LDLEINNGLWNLSPDGTRLAVSRGREGPLEIRSLSGRTSQIVPVKGLNNMLNLEWAASGEAFFVSNRTKYGMEVLHMDLRGNTRALWKSNARCFSVPSPDGRHLAIYDWKHSANMWMMENF